MLFLVNAISMSDHSITCVTDPIQKPGKTDEKRLCYAQSPIPIRDAHHMLELAHLRFGSSVYLGDAKIQPLIYVCIRGATSEENLACLDHWLICSLSTIKKEVWISEAYSPKEINGRGSGFHYLGARCKAHEIHYMTVPSRMHMNMGAQWWKQELAPNGHFSRYDPSDRLWWCVSTGTNCMKHGRGGVRLV